MRNMVIVPAELQMLPSYDCPLCKHPIYKGVRIDREEKFCIDCYKSYAWVQFYREAGLSCRQIYDLRIEHYSDNGYSNTLYND